MAKSSSYSEMTLPAKSSKFVASVEKKTIVGGISELVTGIKVTGIKNALPSNYKLVVQGSYKLNKRVTIILTICLTATEHKN